MGNIIGGVNPFEGTDVKLEDRPNPDEEEVQHNLTTSISIDRHHIPNHVLRFVVDKGIIMNIFRKCQQGKSTRMVVGDEGRRSCKVTNPWLSAFFMFFIPKT